jgi:alpha-mannosidase
MVVSFAAPIDSAYEVDGQERRIGPANVTSGMLFTNIGPYSPKAFAVKLRKPLVSVPRLRSVPLGLPFDTKVATRDDDVTAGQMSGGMSYPAELLPTNLVLDGVGFKLAPNGKNAVTSAEQEIALPKGKVERVDLLVAATEDTSGVFLVGNRAYSLAVPSWTGFIGQWDDRLWAKPWGKVDYNGNIQMTGLEKAYLKETPVAWFATHRHSIEKHNDSYRFSYLFKVSLPVRDGATRLVLAPESKIRVFAASAVMSAGDDAKAGSPLYDNFADWSAPILR